MLSDTEHHSRARDILSTRILLAPWSLSPFASIFRASSRVAQLVEQPAVNRRVAGSSPASGASQPSAPQSLSDARPSPSGAGDGLVTVSGSLSGVGTAHARSRRARPPHAGDMIR